MRPRPVVGEATVPDAVRRLLDKFDYPDREAPAQIIPILPTLGGGGGAPTVVVAASDASELSKSKADYICIGTNDEVTIASAAAVLPAAGGRVLLTEGDFVLGAELVLPDDLTLQGIGRQATYLNGEVATFLLNLATTSEVRDMRVENFTTGGGCIDVVGGRSLIHNVYIESWDATGWGIRKSSGGDLVVDSCTFLGTGDGIISSSGAGDFLTLVNNTFNGCKRAIYISGSASNEILIANNVIRSSDDWGIQIAATTSLVTIIGNILNSNGLSANGAILVDASYGSIVGNVFESTRNGPSIQIDGRDFTVVGNTLDADSEEGIVLNGASGCVVAGNRIDQAGFHGIQLTASSDNLIADNLITGPGIDTNNTYDGIILDGNSDRNVINDNRIIGAGAAPKPRYGINISAAACDDNSYLGNRTGPGTDYGTGAYNDAGTGTVNTWPGAAAPQGDNLL